MYAEHYYGGFGGTDAARVQGYSDALAKAATRIAAGIGEPVYVTQRGGAGGAASGGGASDGQLFALAFFLGMPILARRKPL